eukprot:988498_1
MKSHFTPRHQKRFEFQTNGVALDFSEWLNGVISEKDRGTEDKSRLLGQWRASFHQARSRANSLKQRRKSSKLSRKTRRVYSGGHARAHNHIRPSARTYSKRQPVSVDSQCDDHNRKSFGQFTASSKARRNSASLANLGSNFGTESTKNHKSNKFRARRSASKPVLPMRFDSGVRISDSDSSGYWNQESGSKDPEPVSASVKLKSNSRFSSKSRLKGSQYEIGEQGFDIDKNLKHADKLGKST